MDPMTPPPAENSGDRTIKIIGLVALGAVALCGVCGTCLFAALLLFGGLYAGQ